MEKIPKPKLKAKWSDSPLFWQSEYEFVVPYGMDECIRRINALRKRYWNDSQPVLWFLSPFEKFAVDSQEDNGGVFKFRMRGHTRTLEAELIGSLIYETDQQTRIKIKSGFARSSIIIILMILPIMGIVFLLATHAANSFEILVALGMSFMFSSFITLPSLIFAYPLKF